MTDRQKDGRGSHSPLVCVGGVGEGGGGCKPLEAGANRVNWRYDFCLCSGGELGETKPEVPGHNLYFDTLQLPLPHPTLLQSYVCNLLSSNPPSHPLSRSAGQLNFPFALFLFPPICS